MNKFQEYLYQQGYEREIISGGILSWMKRDEFGDKVIVSGKELKQRAVEFIEKLQIYINKKDN